MIYFSPAFADVFYVRDFGRAWYCILCLCSDDFSFRGVVLRSIGRFGALVTSAMRLMNSVHMHARIPMCSRLQSRPACLFLFSNSPYFPRMLRCARPATRCSIGTCVIGCPFPPLPFPSTTLPCPAPSTPPASRRTTRVHTVRQPTDRPTPARR